MRVLSLATAALATVLASPLAVTAAAVAAPLTLPAAIPDFDGDGHPDIAIGKVEDHRSVHVRYATGRSQVITREDLDGSELYTGFGASILARDLNADGFADLAIADGGDQLSDRTQAVFLVFGSAGGLDVAGARTLATPEGLSRFGTATALVEQPTPLLVVGAPGDSPQAAGGTLVTWTLGSDGLPTGQPVRLTQDSAGIPGAGERGDGFGWSLASTGPVLLVGAPEESVGRVRAAGAVTVLTQRAGGGLTGTAITQATRGVPGSVEADDWFGAAVAAGDGYTVVGAPGEDGGRYGSAGRIQPFRIAAGRLVPLAAIDQSSRGVPGTTEPDDHFGAALAMARPCSGAVGVLVGGPGEAVSSTEFAGAAWLIPLTRASTCRARSYYRGHGLPGLPDELEQVGDSVSVLRTADPLAADALLIAGPGSEDGPSGTLYHLATPGGVAAKAFSGLYSPSGISLTP